MKKFNDKQPPAREIARMNIELDYRTKNDKSNYGNTMPILAPKKVIFLGIGDLIGNKEPFII